jgi:phosphohistidine phosphatase SixA
MSWLRVFTLEENQMRSDLVFGATANVSNRYLLTSIASRATRMLHKPNVRLEDTSNDVFRAFGRANPIAVVNRTPSQHLAVRATHSAAQDDPVLLAGHPATIQEYPIAKAREVPAISR